MSLFIRLLGSGILVQILAILTTLIFSRLFSIDQFGELAFYASFGSLMAVIGGLRFDYIILKNDIKEKDEGFFLSNLVSIFLNIFVVLVVFLLQSIFDILNNINIFYLMSFGLGFSFFNNFSQYLIALKKYDDFIRIRFFQILGVLLLGVFFNYVFFSSQSLLYAYSFSQLLFGFFGFLLILFTNANQKQVFRFFKKNFIEAFKNFSISFMQYSTPLVPVLVGGYIFDQKNIGAYFIFSQMISAPLNIFRRNLLVFFNGELGVKENFLEFISGQLFTIKNIFIFIFILFVLSIIIYIANEQIVSIILGVQWVEYSYLLFPLVIYFLFDCILQPFTTLLPLWGRVNFSLCVEAFRFVLLIFLLPAITIYFNCSFLHFLLIYITIMLGIYILNIFKVIHLSKCEDGSSI